MMSIGEFAQLTGHTLKALRHYDERGVLVPADVDPRTGYRSYDVTQIRPALRLRALREAGVPLADAGAAAVDAAATVTALDTHRQRVAQARREEDAAEHRARTAVSRLDQAVTTTVRPAPRQPYVGVVQRLAPDRVEEDLTTEQADAAFGRLFGALAEAGTPPVGGFWTVLRPGATADAVEIVLCWPVAALPDPPLDLPGLELEAATLPERQEHVARVSVDDEPAEGVLHPGAVALLEQLAARGEEATPDRIRQVGLMDAEGAVTGLELVVDLG